MGATRTIGRIAAATACLAFLGACPPQTKQPKRRSAFEAPSGFASASLVDGSLERPKSAATATAKPAEVVQTLSSLREHRLEITPPLVPSEMLAFGARRLVQASFSKVTFRDSEQGEVITEVEIGSVRAVAHGPDGSLFAIGASGGARLEPRLKTARRFPHVPFFPDSRLLPDLEGPSHFFVYYAEDSELFFYPFAAQASAILPIEASYRLQDCREPLTLLRDGAIVCRTVNGFRRQAPRGSHVEFTFSGFARDDPPVRLLPGMRLDEFFAVTRKGEVLHLRLADALVLLARFQLPTPVYAAAASTDALAFVLVSDPQTGQARRWSLLVTDLSGRSRFERNLPGTTPGAEEDWLTAVVQDKNLAISTMEPLVAVGGPQRVTVWDYAHGRERFTR